MSQCTLSTLFFYFLFLLNVWVWYNGHAWRVYTPVCTLEKSRGDWVSCSTTLCLTPWDGYHSAWSWAGGSSPQRSPCLQPHSTGVTGTQATCSSLHSAEIPAQSWCLHSKRSYPAPPFCLITAAKNNQFPSYPFTAFLPIYISKCNNIFFKITFENHQ